MISKSIELFVVTLSQNKLNSVRKIKLNMLLTINILNILLLMSKMVEGKNEMASVKGVMLRRLELFDDWLTGGVSQQLVSGSVTI